jgi:aromatase
MPGHTERTVSIHAPFPLVWAITNDIENWPKLFTEYASVEILERCGDTVRFRLTMHPEEDGRIWSWVSERSADLGNRTVQAHRVETGPFEYMKIHWSYRDEGDVTRLTWVQDFAMRPEAPVDDIGMETLINANSKIQMDVIRRKIEAIADRFTVPLVTHSAPPLDRARGKAARSDPT